MDFSDIVGTPPPKDASPAPLDFSDIVGAAEPVGFLEDTGSRIAGGWNRLQQSIATGAADIGLISPETAAASFAEDAADIAQYRTDPAVDAQIQDFMAREGFLESLQGVVDNPRAVLATAAQSLPMSAAPWVMGAVGALGGGLAGPGGAIAGGVAGGALGSFATEYTVSLDEGLREQGINPGDPQALVGALQDPAIMEPIRQHAAQRGVPIAAFDALSMGLAGRLAGPVMRGLGGGAMGKIAGGAAELGLQAGAGGMGEAAAQVASEGGIQSWPEVVMEAAAEVPGALIEPIIGRIGATPEQQDKANAAPGAVGGPRSREELIAEGIIPGDGSMQDLIRQQLPDLKDEEIQAAMGMATVETLPIEEIQAAPAPERVPEAELPTVEPVEEITAAPAPEFVPEAVLPEVEEVDPEDVTAAAPPTGEPLPTPEAPPPLAETVPTVEELPVRRVRAAPAPERVPEAELPTVEPVEEITAAPAPELVPELESPEVEEIAPEEVTVASRPVPVRGPPLQAVEMPEEEVELSDGSRARVTRTAQEAMDDVDEREETLRKMLDCLGQGG